MKRIGIDVGGTNTDAVLIADDKVIHSVKCPTTADVTSGILDALTALRTNPAAAVSVRRKSSGNLPPTTATEAAPTAR